MRKRYNKRREFDIYIYIIFWVEKVDERDLINYFSFFFYFLNSKYSLFIIRSRALDFFFPRGKKKFKVTEGKREREIFFFSSLKPAHRNQINNLYLLLIIFPFWFLFPPSHKKNKFLFSSSYIVIESKISAKSL